MSDSPPPPLNQTPAAAEQPAAHSSPEQASRVRSEDLLRGRREIQIVHSGETYRLRVTRAGKLILTK